jgi:hypothetical protein
LKGRWRTGQLPAKSRQSQVRNATEEGQRQASRRRKLRKVVAQRTRLGVSRYSRKTQKG